MIWFVFFNPTFNRNSEFYVPVKASNKKKAMSLAKTYLKSIGISAKVKYTEEAKDRKYRLQSLLFEC